MILLKHVLEFNFKLKPYTRREPRIKLITQIPFRLFSVNDASVEGNVQTTGSNIISIDSSLLR